ncbi:hypothetical protein ASD11_14340 [Aeromicrobium sp. Root495]|uniref:MlaD family protein n=1 Tax=Aeromicrobium sp. Root495 TaxID=1736550 RepID=UPI0006FE5F58|nr:MlaD family protein [Aeromicrobium sp. Root495]KQY55690.1 hypothetical protein ASD11_14340 [Aeromicrobium sp. Root495]
MKIPHAIQPKLRGGILATFIGACVLVFGYLWINMGGTIPVVTNDGYRVSVPMEDVDNMVYDSDVRMAGVRIGKVRGMEVEDGAAQVLLQIDADTVTPLHDGVKIRLRSKSLVEETYVEIEDGSGADLANGTRLDAKAVQPPVQLHDVLTSLDKPTRASLGSAIRSLGESTDGRKASVDQVAGGLGDLGVEGHDVMDALADQSKELKSMVRQTTSLVDALDTRQGQIVTLVKDADRLTKATAASREDLQATMRELPGVLDSAKEATGSLGELSESLTPVAADLRTAAPKLNDSLVELPAVTADLRGLLPALDGTLDRLPKTLKKVPAVAKDGQEIIPTTRTALADLNPMLTYLSPYAPDLTAFFTNWGAMMQHQDANGHYLRIMPVLSEAAVKSLPISTHVGFLNRSNAYPLPGGALNPGSPFSGAYPRVMRDER